MSSLPEGTRFVLPPQAQARFEILGKLRGLYSSWGYQAVEVPALETYQPEHPRAAQSFKLSDRDSGVLALRSDFTPALARLVSIHFPGAAHGEAPARIQYQGTVWHAIHPDLARTREFTQVGIELIGVSNARADAELVHLARESLRLVGLTPRVEVGNPGFVRALFERAEVPERLHAQLADAIDRKDLATVRELLGNLALRPEARKALEGVVDLYGDISVLKRARELAPWPEAQEHLGRLEEVVAEFEDASDLLLDLGMARRLSYYTGMTFRAYTFDYGQPLLGGGRYDGALLGHAAGFSLGLERLEGALSKEEADVTPVVLSLDDAGARRLRRAGIPVIRSLESDVDSARRSARDLGARYLLTDALEPVGEPGPELARLQQLLERADA